MKVRVYEVRVDVKANINGKDVWRVGNTGIIARGLTGLDKVMRRINRQYQVTDYMIVVKHRSDL